jgi:flagella basal body P-ring formation protein FlgA
VAAPLLVKRGDVATLVAEAPGVRVTQMAVAMKSGAKGDVVEFRNVNSERLIKAVVIGEKLALAQQRAGL